MRGWGWGRVAPTGAQRPARSVRFIPFPRIFVVAIIVIRFLSLVRETRIVFSVLIHGISNSIQTFGKEYIAQMNGETEEE